MKEYQKPAYKTFRKFLLGGEVVIGRVVWSNCGRPGEIVTNKVRYEGRVYDVPVTYPVTWTRQLIDDFNRNRTPDEYTVVDYSEIDRQHNMARDNMEDDNDPGQGRR